MNFIDLIGLFGGLFIIWLIIYQVTTRNIEQRDRANNKALKEIIEHNKKMQEKDK